MLVVDATGMNPFAFDLDDAVERGLGAAALVDRNGNTIGLAGAISDEEAMPLAALVMYRLKSNDLSERLFSGEILTLDIEGRSVALAVARRQLFVVALMDSVSPTNLEIVERLVGRIAEQMTSDVGGMPLVSGSGGSGPGPAELALAEYGITVPRTKAKA